MRKVVEERSWLGSVDIGSIELNVKSRDDIPAILIGLQAIWNDKAAREELFRLLDAHVLPDRRRDTGRPGMHLWRILVMGVLKQGLNCDYDRLQELANEHGKIQAFLGHSDWFEPGFYELQNIRDNVELLTPELLREVNRLVVSTGHKVAGKKPGAALVGRCDSFVAETDVRHPTDFGLLRDSVRCLVRAASRACGASGVGGWRQRDHHLDAAGKLYRRVNTAPRWSTRPDEVLGFLVKSLELAAKAKGSLGPLRAAGCPKRTLAEIRRLIGHVPRLAFQIARRVLKEEAVPHGEKLFSIFEEHTRWIAKGKAGKPVELGVPVCIVEDGGGFILDHEIMWTGGDTHVAVPLVGRCLEAFPDLRACSFDRGFHSPENRRKLDAMLEVNALPKKGRLSAADRVREADPDFAAARRRHPGVESAINGLEHRGLGRVRLRGRDRFELAVGLSVLAANIHRLGRVLRDRERLRPERRKRAA